jgi:hypothetical protein
MKARGPEKAGVGGSIPSLDHLGRPARNLGRAIGFCAQRKDESPRPAEAGVGGSIPSLATTLNILRLIGPCDWALARSARKSRETGCEARPRYLDGQKCPRAKIVGRWLKMLLWFSVVVGPPDMHGRLVSSQGWPKLASI